MEKSKDAIEKLFGSTILQTFPNYEIFWSKFIGDPNAAEPQSYEYIFPDTISKDEREGIMKKVEQIQITNYSLFAELAGAHFQLDELTKLGRIDSEQGYFRHWEHFEVAFLHLGSVFYMLDEIFNILNKLTHISERNSVVLS